MVISAKRNATGAGGTGARGKGEDRGVGVRPRRTGPAQGTSRARSSFAGICVLEARARREPRTARGGGGLSPMCASSDDAASIGRGMVKGEADNLWIRAPPGGAGRSLGTVEPAILPTLRRRGAGRREGEHKRERGCGRGRAFPTRPRGKGSTPRALSGARPTREATGLRVL